MSVTFSKPFELVVGPGGRDRSEEAGTGVRSGGWSASRPGRAGEGRGGGREGGFSGPYWGGNSRWEDNLVVKKDEGLVV